MLPYAEKNKIKSRKAQKKKKITVILFEFTIAGMKDDGPNQWS